MTFKFAGARAQVCRYCKFLVARTDRGLASVGRVADLAEIPSPLSLGVTGYWNGKRFEVSGRLQMDRVAAPSAPWQEFAVTLVDSGELYWVAYAQGAWHYFRELSPTPPLPAIGQLRPGVPWQAPGVGSVVISEVGKKRVESGEGELPNVAVPGASTRYADFGGPGGVFGTIDFGDGQAVAPRVFVGQRFDPASFKLDSGQPLDKPQAQVTACTCPTCGGSLPLVTPGTTERIVCRYCGSVSDVAKTGVLSAVGQAPPPPQQPFIPLGAEGDLRGNRVIAIGFVVRGTWVEGEHYSWREYLLYAGPNKGYIWLMEEDLKWQLVVPIPPGEAQAGSGVMFYQGNSYALKQSVAAAVEYVVGEFYWKVAVGETTQATEFQGPGGLISVEQDHNEMNTSFCYPLTAREIGLAFRIAAPPEQSAVAFKSSSITSSWVFWLVIIVAVLFLLSVATCDDDGGSGSSGSSGVYIGPGYSGK